MIPNKSKAFKTFSMGSCHLSRHISVSHTIYERRAPLWLGFGYLRDKVVDKLIDLRKNILILWLIVKKTISDERKLGRQRHNSNPMSILVVLIIRPYSQFVKTTVLVAILSWWQMAFQVHSNTHHRNRFIADAKYQYIDRKLLLIIELR